MDEVSLSEDEEVYVEFKKKENTIWKILMPNKSRKDATQAELKILDEIEALIERQPNVQKTLTELRNLDSWYEN